MKKNYFFYNAEKPLFYGVETHIGQSTEPHPPPGTTCENVRDMIYCAASRAKTKGNHQ